MRCTSSCEGQIPTAGLLTSPELQLWPYIQVHLAHAHAHMHSCSCAHVHVHAYTYTQTHTRACVHMPNGILEHILSILRSAQGMKIITMIITLIHCCGS